MNNNFDKERVDELLIDEWIWIAFIILSILNITGDEFEKKYCYYHEEKSKNTSKKIFTFTVFISFIIYNYLAYKNCNKYKKALINNQDTNIITKRCIASILIVIASTLLLSAQLEDKNPTNPSLE